MTVNLVRFKKNGTPFSFALRNGITVIGRSSQCRLCIPVMSVSKKHCQIQVDNDNVEISDLGSRNGTFVNNIPVLEPHSIKPGDSIKIGPVKFIFQINGQPDLSKKAAVKQEAPKQAQPVVKVTPPNEPAKPTPDEDIDLGDDLELLDDNLDFDKDIDAMGSSASSLH